MYSDEDIKDRNVGMQYLINEGMKFINSGDKSFENIKINPDEFKVLLFTSGTTSSAKGVMLTSRNLAENINAATAYAKVYPEDRFFQYCLYIILMNQLLDFYFQWHGDVQ